MCLLSKELARVLSHKIGTMWHPRVTLIPGHLQIFLLTCLRDSSHVRMVEAHAMCILRPKWLASCDHVHKECRTQPYRILGRVTRSALGLVPKLEIASSTRKDPRSASVPTSPSSCHKPAGILAEESVVRSYKQPSSHWTRLVIVKDQSSHLVYLNICIK